MKTSEQINELAAAMAKAQGEFAAAERGHTARVESKKGAGSSYSYNYADLAAYHEVSRNALAANGLAVFQSPATDGDKVTVSTLLTHTSGQWICSDPITLVADHDPDKQPTPQAIGSAITYARRYSLSALLNMAADDDDGASGSGIPAETTKREPLPECPKCKTNKSVIVGRPEYGGGYVCYQKKDGCGHKWQLNLPPVGDKSNGHGEPNLSVADAELLSAASTKIHNAQSEEDLDLVVRSVEVLSEPVKAVLRPLFRTRREVIRTADQTAKPF